MNFQFGIGLWDIIFSKSRSICFLCPLKVSCKLVPLLPPRGGFPCFVMMPSILVADASNWLEHSHLDAFTSFRWDSYFSSVSPNSWSSSHLLQKFQIHIPHHEPFLSFLILFSQLPQKFLLMFVLVELKMIPTKYKDACDYSF